MAARKKWFVKSDLNLLVGEVLDVILDILVRELATDETLDVEDGSVGVGRSLVLGGVTNKSLLIGEGDIRRGNTVSLVVDENLDLALLHHTNATTRLLVSLSPKDNVYRLSKPGRRLVVEVDSKRRMPRKVIVLIIVSGSEFVHG